jgi:hypothetical protein
LNQLAALSKVSVAGEWGGFCSHVMNFQQEKLGGNNTSIFGYLKKPLVIPKFIFGQYGQFLLRR